MRGTSDKCSGSTWTTPPSEPDTSEVGEGLSGTENGRAVRERAGHFEARFGWASSPVLQASCVAIQVAEFLDWPDGEACLFIAEIPDFGLYSESFHNFLCPRPKSPWATCGPFATNDAGWDFQERQEGLH